jgi:uncharacterized protein YdbL (DUF1318 family)
MPMARLRTLLTVIALGLTLAVPAFALDLHEARTKGLLGEQWDGYVGIVASPTPELERLAADVNAKRKAHYQEIAQRNGTQLEAVAALAGKKLVEGAPSGQFVKTNGGWTRVP